MYPSDAYTNVTICGVVYTQGADDGICPDYYFPSDAGDYNASTDDPDCSYINISISNASSGSYNGWNLITIPQEINNYIKNGRLGEIFIDHGIVYVERLNYSLLSGGYTLPYDLTQYNDGESWTVEFIQIEEGRSYWVNVTNAFNLTVPYTPLVNYTIELVSSGDSGLNMVAWFSNRTATIADELSGTDCEDLISYVYRWDVDTQDYEAVTNGTGFTGAFSTFEPGEGYWLEVANGQSCNWTYIP